MKPLQIWTADWCFIEKDTNNIVAALNVVTHKLPKEFVIKDKRSFNRALDEFGENNIKYINNLIHKNGRPYVSMIIYRKFIGESNFYYEIVNNELHVINSENSQVFSRTPKVMVEESATSNNRNIGQSETELQSTKESVTQSKEDSRSDLKETREIITTEQNGFDWNQDF
jgi:hypothetical protein